MVDTPKPNGKVRFRDEFISWNTVKHLLLILGIVFPVVGATWAWASSAQAQTVEIATTLKDQVRGNSEQHARYEVLETTATAIASNARAIDRVAECMKSHLAYEKQTDVKIDALMLEQRQMAQKTRDEVMKIGVEQRVLRDEIKRLAREVRKNGLP